jgi:hypothetical protein
MAMCKLFTRRWGIGLAAGLTLLGLPAALAAQPFFPWSEFVGDGTLDSTNGALTIPDNPALNPTSAMTIEAWIQFTEPAANQRCRSIIGKNYQASYWVGVCNNGSAGELRSYTHGTTSQNNGGVIPNGTLVHIAVTTDGVTRRHYIDGELVGTFTETGPPTGSISPLIIGGDASWAYSPKGLINEVRLWNVARTQAEIQSTINVHLSTAQPGLVAVWLMGSGHDAVGGHDGVLSGDLPPILAPPAISNCGSSSASALCLQGKFFISITERVGAPGTASTQAAVQTFDANSGVFSFFDPTDWEVLVKVINGCVLSNTWWVFTASATNVRYQMDVTDVQSGVTKIYFNYPGPPAPALTDTNAFPCP